MSELAYKRTNVYETADERKLKEIFDYAEGYRAFIDAAKTEREACDYVAEEAEKRGYKPFKFGAKLKAGDRVYYNNRGKNIYLIKVGTADIARDGIRIVASHIDSPRVDLKQVPLYESDGVGPRQNPLLRRYPQISVGGDSPRASRQDCEGGRNGVRCENRRGR